MRGKLLYHRLRHALPPPLRARLDSAAASLIGRRMLVRLVLARRRRHAEPDRLFVGWLLSEDRNSGSTRVRGLLPHTYVRKNGVHSVVLAQRQRSLRMRPKDAARIVRAGFDVVVFGFVSGPEAEDLARTLRGVGTRTVYAMGELNRTRMPEVVDSVVVASEGLVDRTGGPSDKVSVIESAIETPSGMCKQYSRPAPGGSIRVVWVGYPENLHLLEPVREALERPELKGFELITISRGPEVTFQWHRERVWEQLLQCDIAVLPSNETDWYWSKPNTRMTMLKALGLPIVASPIPSYLATLTDGRGCYFARDVDEWAQSLRSLSDLERRREMGLAEREEVLERYGLDAIGRRWLELFEGLAGAGDPVPHPALSA
jgi:glycosyltransferase involved in cell wall biosynthesis